MACLEEESDNVNASLKDEEEKRARNSIGFIMVFPCCQRQIIIAIGYYVVLTVVVKFTRSWENLF
eukprot:7662700-Ditylum_brightwellii.AAC.1